MAETDVIYSSLFSLRIRGLEKIANAFSRWCLLMVNTDLSFTKGSSAQAELLCL